MDSKVNVIIEKYSKRAERLMDILLDVQQMYSYIPKNVITQIADELFMSVVDVEQTMSFYHFFSKVPRGKNTIYLNNSVVSCMNGHSYVAKAFEAASGCRFGEVSRDGAIGLFHTACIGMSDQEPAAIINGTVFTKLSPAKVYEIVGALKKGAEVSSLVTSFGDGANNSPHMKTMIKNNIKLKGQVLFSQYSTGTALNKLKLMSADQVIDEVKASNMRGRGGAGFPTGMKWDFCKRSKDTERYLICNADEGEPGTFKDRVLLTEYPALLFEGMAIAGYAISAKEGILYLRYEYKYMREHLENTLTELRNKNLLGDNISGINGFNFDIRIQFGAGAYVCGEESALIESAEGKRGEPRNRPPFPVQKGYLGKPTVINNVESLCTVVKVIEKGADWYKTLGTKDSTGSKLLCISGDCKNPGVYEIDWGMSVAEMLEMVGAENTQAVVVGGPSGKIIAQNEFNRKIAYEDLPTGGAMIVVGNQRDIIKDVVMNFIEFFIGESCGSCVPCRALTIALKHKLEKLLEGRGVEKDLVELEHWGKLMKLLNRCGLGQTAANPILSTMENFREDYNKLLQEGKINEFTFNLAESVKESCDYVGRKADIHHTEQKVDFII